MPADHGIAERTGTRSSGIMPAPTPLVQVTAARASATQGDTRFNCAKKVMVFTILD